MSLILRVDVDKAYGRRTIIEKAKSKFREDLWFPAIDYLGYLRATESFIAYCNQHNVRGVFYFRNCTAPGNKILTLLRKGNHQLGFHAENTKSLESFTRELAQFRKKLPNTNISHFTKHGSGDIKLGKNHYAPYEPDKYISWSKEIGLPYLFGNEITGSPNDFKKSMDFYPHMFWIHNDYRHENFNKIEDLIRYAKDVDIPVIIHPSNFLANSFVNAEFKKLVSLAKESSLTWHTIK